MPPGASAAAFAAGTGTAAPALAEGSADPGTVGFEGSTESGVKYKIVQTTTAPGDKVGLVETAKKGDFVILTITAKGADGSVIMDTTKVCVCVCARAFTCCIDSCSADFVQT